MDFFIEIEASKLGKDLENLSESTERELDGAVANLANVAYSKLVSQVQQSSMADKNRRAYLSGLKFEDFGDGSYLITLDGDWAESLEGGFPSFSLKDALLNSSKIVSKGSRSGKNWVRTAKDGTKYAAVPFEKKVTALKGDMEKDIRQITAKNRQGIEQNITKIFKDDFGKPIQGKVATGRSDNSKLDNLVKYQSVSDTGKVTSLYMNYRMISEKSQGWMHPGWKGHRFFQETEKFIQEELDNILRILL